MNLSFISRCLAFAAAVAMTATAAPIIVTGANPSTAGLDTEWAARARNLDNRAGTWKPIIFGDDAFTNNANAVNSMSNWTISSNVVQGAFELSFVRTAAGPRGTARFKTANHDISNTNAGVDADTVDGVITNLYIHAIDSNDSTIDLTNLKLEYNNITVLLPSINTPSGSTVTNAGVLVGNLLAAFGDGFKLTGNYRIEHDGSVPDESPRFEIKALSGGTIDTPVPEPASYALIGAGLIGLATLRRKRG